MSNTSASVATVALLGASLLTVGIASPASATPSASSSGYIYHLTNTSPSKFYRYNIAEDVDEQIGAVDSSCDFIGSGWRISDLEVDDAHNVAYFIYTVSTWPAADTSTIRKMDLATGTCSTVISNSSYNANGLEPTWRGLTVDPTRNLLFFIDNQGYPNKDMSGHDNAVNETLHYVDLNAGTPVDTVLPIVKKSNTPGAGVQAETTDLTFGHDITIAGDYAYIGGKNKRPSTGCGATAECDAWVESTFGALTDASTASTAVFRVRLFDAATHNLITGTSLQSEKIFALLPSDSTDADISHVVIKNGYAYFSTFDWHEGGINKFRLSDFTSGSGTPITASTAVVDNYSYDITYGFASAPSTSGGDYLFYTDRLTAPEWRLVWAQESGSSATSGTETQASSNTDQFGQIQYGAVATPHTPEVSGFVRVDANTATLTFATPSDAQSRTHYLWTVTGSDSSEMSGSCDSSPCTITGLDGSLTYRVSMRQQWASGGTEIIHSLESSPIDEAASFTSVTKSFGGFITMSSALTQPIKRAVGRWVTANPGGSSVSCTGYVGNNYLDVSPTELRSLARARAKATCSYVHRLDTDIAVGEIDLVISSSKNASIRKVKVTLD